MSEFQLILAIIALSIFIIFFKQLFSGNYPKRGVDYESKLPPESIGGVSRPDKIFHSTKQTESKSRIDELFEIAQKALDSGDNIEAKKALEALLILEPNNKDALRMLGVAYMNMNNYVDAKERFLEVLAIDPNDDLTHNLLANTLHKLGEDKEAIEYHKKAIELDPYYAAYYYNYANTLYEIGKKSEALSLYKKALELDPTLKDAQKMIKELEDVSN